MLPPTLSVTDEMTLPEMFVPAKIRPTVPAAIVVAGIVDGTVITGATFVADGTSGEFLATEGQGLGKRWRWRTALQFGYANQLLLADTPEGRIHLVESRSVLEASA